MSDIVIKRNDMTIEEAEEKVREVWGKHTALSKKHYPLDNLTLWFDGQPDENYQNYIAEMGRAALVIQEPTKPFHQIDMPPVIKRDGTTIQATMNVKALCVDKIDNMAIETITEVAKENGITNVMLFEKGFVLDAVRNELKRRETPGEISDGYHTFNELYDHRCTLFAMICADHQDNAWKSLKHHDGTMYQDMFVCGIITPYGQANYHMNVEPYWNMIQVKELPNAPEWDGHTPKMALERIAQMVMDRFVQPCGGIVE